MQTGDDTSPKVRRQQAVRSTTVMIAVGISEEGYREILGLKVGFSETGEGWRAIFSDLKARGLSGVEMLTSDAHDGLRGAAQQSFPGAIWQRCHTEESLGVHFRRNVADRVPAASKERVHEMLDSILEAPSPADAREALERAATELEEMALPPLRCWRTDLRTLQPRWRSPRSTGGGCAPRTWSNGLSRRSVAARRWSAYLPKHAGRLAPDRSALR